jgi:hypothetical protein
MPWNGNAPMDGSPTISVLIPTRNRKRFMAAAIESFLRQTWINKELIIIEDGDEDCRDLLPPQSRLDAMQWEGHDDIGTWVRYFRLDGTVGAKLNFGAQQARGEYCARFDDDDWQAAARLEGQFNLAQMTGKAVVVCGSVAHYIAGSPEAYEHTGDVWAAGGASHFFRREYALQHPYPDNSFGEDWEFALRAYQHGELAAISGVTWVVAQIHPDNTSPRAFSDPKERDFLLTSDNWRLVGLDQIRSIVSL